TSAVTAPVANAGPDQTVAVGATVTLDGSKSSDSDGHPLTYAWTFVLLPPGSLAVLTGRTSVSPSFVADVSGVYTVQLVVSDNNIPSPPSTVTITTKPGNTKPVANAGLNQVVTVGSIVQLDGSKSTDVDGNPLTYQWSLITLPAGSKAALSNAASVNPTFTADLQGTYVAQLIVNDGLLNSDPSTATISSNPVNPLAPTANAGPGQTVHEALVMLTGSGTDPQGLPLPFHWSLTTVPAGSNANLSNANIPNPTFFADVLGDYVAQLIVNNGTLNSTPSTVTITNQNTAPVANAGSPQTVAIGATVTLDGTQSSDANNDPLTYKWSLLSTPPSSAAVWVGARTASPTFVADLAGTYVAQLIVNDGFVDSQPSTVTITASNGPVIMLSPDPLSLSNGPGQLTVAIGAAPAPGSGGQKITLTVFDPTVATAPASVTIPEGSTSTTASITPVGQGSTTIFGTASGFKPGSATINVGAAALTLSFDSTTVGVTKSINGTVTLNASAPPSGVTVTLSVDKPGIITLSPSLNIPGGSSVGTFSVVGATTGAVNVSASAPGYLGSSDTITVVPLGAISLQSNLAVGVGQTLPIGVTLIQTPAPKGGVTITLASSNTSILTVSPSVFIAEGTTTPATPAQVTGVNLGSATVTASASGFSGDSETVQVSENLSFSPAALTLATNTTQNITLNLSGSAPGGGLAVTLKSDNPTI